MNVQPIIWPFLAALLLATGFPGTQAAVQDSSGKFDVASDADPKPELPLDPTVGAADLVELAPIQDSVSAIFPELEGGTASYYGQRFHGRMTASGEPFDMNALTAAHRSLPFGSMVRVTNTRNGRSVVVRINDRGPFVESRVIDVSRAAAKKLGLIRPGHARVDLELVEG